MTRILLSALCLLSQPVMAGEPPDDWVAALAGACWDGKVASARIEPKGGKCPEGTIYVPPIMPKFYFDDPPKTLSAWQDQQDRARRDLPNISEGRPYTVADIEALRDAVRNKISRGRFDGKGGFNQMCTSVPEGLCKTFRSYDTRDVEAQVQTYILAGIRAEDLIESEKAK